MLLPLLFKHTLELLILVFNLTYLLYLWQISLLEIPEHKRKKMTNLTTNVMRDENDKVSMQSKLVFLPLDCLDDIYSQYVIGFSTWSAWRGGELAVNTKSCC